MMSACFVKCPKRLNAEVILSANGGIQIDMDVLGDENQSLVSALSTQFLEESLSFGSRQLQLQRYL